MAANSSFIAGTVNDVHAILDLIEQAQAIAAARNQEWNARTAAGDVLVTDDFSGMTFTLAQFNDVQTSLVALASILGGHSTVLYRVKE